MKAYERTGDELRIYGKPLSRIIYYFFKDRLYLVRLEWSTNVGYDILTGFGEAFGGCEPAATDVGNSVALHLRASGKKVEFEGEQRIVDRIYGWAVLEQVGAEEAIRIQIQQEAAGKF